MIIIAILIGLHLFGAGGFFIFSRVSNFLGSAMGGAFGYPSRRQSLLNDLLQSLVWEGPLAIELYGLYKDIRNR